MIPRRLGSLLTITSLASVVAFAAPAAAINDGRIAEDGQYPAMAYVYLEDEGGQCGGTVVAPTKVVTAAHCVYQSGAIVVLDETSSTAIWEENAGDVHEVVDIAVHPDYDVADVDYDIAVLTLNPPTDLAPARLPTPAEAALWSWGTDATIAGWGAIDNTNEASDDLRSATVTIKSDGYCDSGSDGIGCTAGLAKACFGDGGGPVLVDDNGDPVLVGVITFTSGDCEDTMPTYFQRTGADAIHRWLKIETDTVAPRVATHSPAGTGVDRDVNARAVFSEEMRRGTLNETTFKLFRIGVDGVARRVQDVAVIPRSDGKVATLNPAARLGARTRYKVVVATGALDLARLNLDQNRQLDGNQQKVWFFKTGAS